MASEDGSNSSAGDRFLGALKDAPIVGLPIVLGLCMGDAFAIVWEGHKALEARRKYENEEIAGEDSHRSRGRTGYYTSKRNEMESRGRADAKDLVSHIVDPLRLGRLISRIPHNVAPHIFHALYEGVSTIAPGLDSGAIKHVTAQIVFEIDNERRKLFRSESRKRIEAAPNKQAGSRRFA